MKLYLQAQYQIFISVILTVSVVCLTSLFLWYNNQVLIEVRQASGKVMDTGLMNQVESRGLALTRSLSSNLVNPLYHFRSEAIYRLLQNALSNSDVLSAEVFDNNGIIQHDGTHTIERYGEQVNDTQMVSALLEGESNYKRIVNDQLVVAHPIRIGNKLLGGVRLTLSLEMVHGNIASMNNALKQINEKSRKKEMIIATVVALFSLSASLLMGMILARYLVHPIKKLANAAQRIGEGDYLQTLKLERKDELGELADAFNIMAKNLADHQKEISHIAYHDSLTQLPNRLMLKKVLNEAIAETEDGGSLLALMLIDLDDFKQVNDTLGHDAGDLLLKFAAERIADEVRGLQDIVVRHKSLESTGHHMVSRLGGDEFTVVANGLHNEEDGATIARRIIDSLKKPFVINEQLVLIGASIGITLSPQDGSGAEVLLKNADLAMYQAKYKGKNTYAFFSEHLTEEVERVARVKKELGAALENDEFVLFYQPQISLCDRTISGCEVLIRWNHPEQGLLPPLEFIPVAEECGLIGQIDEWVLENACKQLPVVNNGDATISIGVNLSPQQLTDDQLPAKLSSYIERYAIDPRLLHLEITETMLIKDELHAIDTLNKVHDLGFPIWLDDFGTGFSSLSHLQRFPLSGIKIDRQFIRNLNASRRSQQLVQALITLGKMLDLEVIAEGVETEEQAAALKRWECPFAQGFLFHTPMPADHFLDVLANKRFYCN